MYKSVKIRHDNNYELINQINLNKFLNSESLNKAYKFALDAHQNQKEMRSLILFMAVAKILTELKLDASTIMGLLHAIEDTNVTYQL